MVAEARAVERDIPIDELSQKWGVSTKAIQTWCQNAGRAWGQQINHNAPLPPHHVALVDHYAKHVSKQAYQYFGETGQSRRLLSHEYAELVQKERAAHQQPQPTQEHGYYAPTEEGDEYDQAEESYSALARIADRQVRQTQSAIAAYDQFEDQRVVAPLAHYITDEIRPMQKLATQVRAIQTAKKTEGRPSFRNLFEAAFNPVPSVQSLPQA